MARHGGAPVDDSTLHHLVHELCHSSKHYSRVYSKLTFFYETRRVWQPIGTYCLEQVNGLQPVFLLSPFVPHTPGRRRVRQMVYAAN